MARRVDGMGFEVEFKTMEAVPGGHGGGGWRVGRRGPRAKVVEGKFGHGEEEVPEIRGGKHREWRRRWTGGGSLWFAWHVQQRGNDVGRGWQR